MPALQSSANDRNRAVALPNPLYCVPLDDNGGVVAAET